MRIAFPSRRAEATASAMTPPNAPMLSVSS